jgi:hypothetical protein
MINNLQDLSAIRVRQCRRIQRRQQRVVTINQNHVTLPERRALGERELFFIFLSYGFQVSHQIAISRHSAQKGRFDLRTQQSILISHR